MLGARAFLHLGERDKAMQFAEAALHTDPDSESTNYNGACFYALAGEIEKALDCLEDAIAFNDPDWMDNDADLDPLRGEPRFQALMASIRGNGS
jgi:adenylate cyclase